MSKTIKLLKESLGGCPMIWDCELDGDLIYIRYRWGTISIKNYGVGILGEPLESEQIGDGFDGVLEVEKAIEWLESKGYKVINEIKQLPDEIQEN